jgi:O-glycosyl hydrolase
MSLKLIDFKPLWLLSIAPIVFGLCSCSNAPAGTSTVAAAGPVTAAVYQTSIGSNSLLASQPGVTFATTVTVGSTTIQVTPANVLQPWDGVGGALTDSAATVIAALPAAQQQTLQPHQRHRSQHGPAAHGFERLLRQRQLQL